LVIQQIRSSRFDETHGMDYIGEAEKIKTKVRGMLFLGVETDAGMRWMSPVETE